MNLYTDTILFFCVLILKVVNMYTKPSMVVVLKESKCMYMSYIIINPLLLWIEIYEAFHEFIIYPHFLMQDVLLLK